MKEISIQIPADLEAELEAYADAENIDKDAAVRRLLAGGLNQWQTELALEQVEAGEATISGGAKIAEMSVWDFAATAKAENVTLVSGNHLESDLQDL